MVSASLWLLRQGKIQPMTMYSLPYPKMSIVLARMCKLTWEIQGHFLSNRYLSCKDKGEGSWICSPMYYTVGRHPNLEFQKQMCSQFLFLRVCSHMPAAGRVTCQRLIAAPPLDDGFYLTLLHFLDRNTWPNSMLWPAVAQDWGACCYGVYLAAWLFCLPSLLWRAVLPCWW